MKLAHRCVTEESSDRCQTAVQKSEESNKLLMLVDCPLIKNYKINIKKNKVCMLDRNMIIDLVKYIM